jgi:hypothetical protein
MTAFAEHLHGYAVRICAGANRLWDRYPHAETALRIAAQLRWRGFDARVLVSRRSKWTISAGVACAVTALPRGGLLSSTSLSVVVMHANTPRIAGRTRMDHSSVFAFLSAQRITERIVAEVEREATP